ELIRYGAPLLDTVPEDGVRSLGLEPGESHLVVARFEPANDGPGSVEGHRRSRAGKPLVVRGAAPDSAHYTRAIADAAPRDRRVRRRGPACDRTLLDALYAHAFTVVRGRRVGGTDPSLLRALGAGSAVIAFDGGFNREALDDQGWFSTATDDLSPLFA